MSETNYVSRRQFVAGASGLLLAGAVHQAAGETVSKQESQLALHGGEKAVKESAASGPRWGEPERQQLEAMLQQDSLVLLAGTADQAAHRTVSERSVR